jgi:hypothetical protein
MAGFGQMSKGGRGGGGGGPQENVVFQVIGYHVKDTRGNTYSPEDYIEAYLFRDACGIKAEFDENNNPITKVKISLRPDDRQNPTFARPSIGEFRKGNHMGKGMGEHSIGYAEGCWLDQKTGNISGRWLNRIYPEFNPELNYPMFGVMASVRPEGEFNRADGTKRAYQNRLVPLTDNAASVRTMDELRNEAIVLLNSLAETEVPGDHGFIVRGVDLDDLGRNATEFFVPWDKEATAPMSAEKAVDQWIASEAGQEWAGVLEQVAGTNFVLEVIPQLRIDTGSFSLPSKKRETALREGKRVGANVDDSSRYLYTAEGEERTQAMYALSDLEIQRSRKTEPGEEGFTRWVSTGTRPTQGRAPLFAADELITPNLPEHVVEQFSKIAADRAKAMADRAAAARQAPSPEPSQEPEPENSYKM